MGVLHTPCFSIVILSEAKDLFLLKKQILQLPSLLQNDTV